MKFFAGILLAAGSLLGTLQLPAQGRPVALGHELAQSPARESAAEPGRKQPAEFAAGSPGVPATELPAEFSAKAHAAASSLRMLPPEEFGLRWLQEEVNPYLRARRKLHRTMQERAAQQEESLIRSRQKYPHDLNFTLLADTDHSVCEAYGVWAEKSMYGRKYMGVLRTTFVIDAEGRIEKVFTKVDTANHYRQILDAYK